MGLEELIKAQNGLTFDAFELEKKTGSKYEKEHVKAVLSLFNILLSCNIFLLKVYFVLY